MNGNFTEFKLRTAEYLAGLESFGDASVVLAYPEKRREFPLKKPVVTVEVLGAELVPAGLGGYLGGDEPLYGASALITLSFGIYCAEAVDCGAYYESLCDALFNAEELAARKISCARCEFDAATAAYVMRATAELKAAWVVSKPQERLFNEIYLKEVKS